MPAPASSQVLQLISQAGLQVGDELIALGGERVRQLDDLNLLLAKASPAEPVEAVICRDGRVRSLTLSPAEPQCERWELRINPEAPASAHARRDAWIRLCP